MKQNIDCTSPFTFKIKKKKCVKLTNNWFKTEEGK